LKDDLEKAKTRHANNTERIRSLGVELGLLTNKVEREAKAGLGGPVDKFLRLIDNVPNFTRYEDNFSNYLDKA